MSVKMRQEVERKIIRRFVKDALAAGYRLAVSLDRGYDTDEMLLGSRDVTAILEAATAGDDCHIFVQPGDGPTLDENGRVVSRGHVYLVFGNDGYDVISDYTTNLESLLAGANEVADRYS
jgi:hypothetical protein